MKIRFSKKQEIETDGIIGVKQEEAMTVVVRYPKHEVRIQGVTASEVMAKITAAKKNRDRR